VDLWNEVVTHCDDFNADRERAFERLDPSLRRIVTGDEGAFGSAQMSLGFRLPPDLSPDTLANDLRLLLGPEQVASLPSSTAQSPAADHQIQVHLEFSGAEAAFRAEKNTPLVRAFLATIRKQGGRARFVLKTGTSDMNVVGPVWGCPIVAYGPGDSALDHTPDERIGLSEYLRSIEILESVLQMVMKNT
jgi:LysW-gamma-L-lysine carboxypeptidase